MLTMYLGLSHLDILQSRVQELQDLNDAEHEKFTRQIRTLAETLEDYIDPERGPKRIRVNETSSQDNSSEVKATLQLQNYAVADTRFPLKTILQSLASQALQLIIREITLHRRFCKQDRQ